MKSNQNNLFFTMILKEPFTMFSFDNTQKTEALIKPSITVSRSINLFGASLLILNLTHQTFRKVVAKVPEFCLKLDSCDTVAYIWACLEEVLSQWTRPWFTVQNYKHT